MHVDLLINVVSITGTSKTVNVSFGGQTIVLSTDINSSYNITGVASFRKVSGTTWLYDIGRVAYAIYPPLVGVVNTGTAPTSVGVTTNSAFDAGGINVIYY